MEPILTREERRLGGTYLGLKREKVSIRLVHAGHPVPEDLSERIDIGEAATGTRRPLGDQYLLSLGEALCPHRV
jgi:hypothetical protein